MSGNDPLISAANDLNLMPEDSRTMADTWMANCPSGRQHRVYLELRKGLFTCPWCARRGNAEELKDWVRTVKSDAD